LHLRIEHTAKQIVAEIVVHLTNLPGPFAGLRIGQPGKCNTKKIGKISWTLLVQFGSQQLFKEGVKTLTVPPAFHIAFAKAERALL
jgi:hypothetical protein